MLLTQDRNAAKYSIQQVSSDGVYINEEKYTQHLIVMPHKIISPWRVTSFECLQESEFTPLLAENVDIVLLGSGETGKKFPLELYYRLLDKKLIIESMSLAAACRTYAILSAEGRSVAAALLFDV